MTPLEANTPQTVLDLLFPPGEDSSVAVAGIALLPDYDHSADAGDETSQASVA